MLASVRCVGSITTDKIFILSILVAASSLVSKSTSQNGPAWRRKLSKYDLKRGSKSQLCRENTGSRAYHRALGFGSGAGIVPETISGCDILVDVL